MKTPTRFLNQREAYWYRKGVEHAKKSVDFILDQDIKRQDPEWLDHLPEGDDEKNK